MFLLKELIKCFRDHKDLALAARSGSRKHLISSFSIPFLFVFTFFSIFTLKSFADQHVVKPSITMSSSNTSFSSNEAGSWQMTKSAKWVGKNKAQIKFEVESTAKYGDNNVDVLFVLDNSGSMSGEPLDKIKADAKDTVDSILSNSGNRISLVTFNSTSDVLSNWSTDATALKNQIEALGTTGATNYYSGFKNAEAILDGTAIDTSGHTGSPYVKQAGRDLIMIFMSDGQPNEQTPNEIAEYDFLKQTYPYITINAIQYNMGESLILDAMKVISDQQWVANSSDPNNFLLEASINPYIYDKFIMEDLLEDDYWDGATIDKVIQTLGSSETLNPSNVVINKTATPPTIKWDLSGIYRSDTKASLTLEVTLKDEYKDEAGIGRLFPTNEGTTITSELPDTPDENVTTDDTPVLKVDYKVTYEPNSPSTCTVTNMPSPNPETQVIFDTVAISENIPVCNTDGSNPEDKYEFKGWEIIDPTDVTKVGDDYFIMPEADVEIIAIWTKPTISKAMDGKVQETNLFSITTMQEMTAQVCSNTPTPSVDARDIDTVGDGGTDKVPTTTLTDTRDGKTYTVSKLADGNCWMTQNLDLGDNSTEQNPLVLTPEDSNVSANFELPAMQKGNDYGSNYKWNEGGAGNTTNTKHMYDFTGHSTYDANATTYGNLYNWYTATAGTGTADMTSGDATDSICPKGWQLPSNYGNKSYNNLLTTTYALSGSAGSTTMQNVPFSFPFAGDYGYSDGSLYVQGGNGLFWSSTAGSTNNAIHLSFNRNGISPNGSYGKAYGSSVRCVAQ